MDTSNLGSRILARLIILCVTGFNKHGGVSELRHVTFEKTLVGKAGTLGGCGDKGRCGEKGGCGDKDCANKLLVSGDMYAVESFNLVHSTAL